MASSYFSADGYICSFRFRWPWLVGGEAIGGVRSRFTHERDREFGRFSTLGWGNEWRRSGFMPLCSPLVSGELQVLAEGLDTPPIAHYAYCALCLGVQVPHDRPRLELGNMVLAATCPSGRSSPTSHHQPGGRAEERCLSIPYNDWRFRRQGRHRCCACRDTG